MFLEVNILTRTDFEFLNTKIHNNHTWLTRTGPYLVVGDRSVVNDDDRIVSNHLFPCTYLRCLSEICKIKAICFKQNVYSTDMFLKEIHRQSDIKT